MYSIVYWSRVQVKSLAFQGLNLDKVRTLLYPLCPPLSHSRLQHHHCPRCPHCYFINGFPGPPANTLMPSVPRDLNGAFRTPFSDLKSPHPRFGPLLLLMMVNRATIQIHFTEAPVPPAEQERHINGLSLGCGRVHQIYLGRAACLQFGRININNKEQQ